MKFKEAVEILKQGWCQGSLAKDKEGFTTNPLHHDATSFCAIGALVKAHGASRQIIEDQLKLEELLMEEGIRGLAEWNDTPGRTVEEVIKLFEEASC